MIRWSINDKKDIFQSAVIEVLELCAKGNARNEIIQTLSPKYQEKEIGQLVDWIKDLPKLNQFKKEKMLLKISLWMLLVDKLLVIISHRNNIILDSQWGIGVMFLLPMVNVLAVVLAYRVTSMSYGIIFMILIFNLSNLSNIIGPLFSIEGGMFVWCINTISVIVFFIALYVSFKLFRALPEGLIKTNILITQLKLNVPDIAW